MPRKKAGSSDEKATARGGQRLVGPVSRGEAAVYQMKIVLIDVETPIWRDFRVPASIKLSKLSDVIQIAMGWQNEHLHEFSVGEMRIGVSDPEYASVGTEIIDERKIRLKDVVAGEGGEFTYVYDFGDEWVHKLIVKEVLSTKEEEALPRCLAGARRCPPEDCGGPWGYAKLIEAIADPSHPDHDEMLGWVGGKFDPERFDLRGINRKLQRLK